MNSYYLMNEFPLSPERQNDLEIPVQNTGYSYLLTVCLKSRDMWQMVYNYKRVVAVKGLGWVTIKGLG